jgi:hypothetical protein
MKRKKVSPLDSPKCECGTRDEAAMCTHYRSCLEDAKKISVKTRRTIKATQRCSARIEKKLARNMAYRQQHCLRGKQCRCEGWRDFASCPSNMTSVCFGSVMHNSKIKPGVVTVGSLSRLDEYAQVQAYAGAAGVPFTVMHDSHIGVPGPDLTTVLADALKRGVGAVVVLSGDGDTVHTVDALEAGTRAHQALEEFYKHHAPAVSIYDVLEAYGNVVARNAKRERERDRIEIHCHTKPVDPAIFDKNLYASINAKMTKSRRKRRKKK